MTSDRRPDFFIIGAPKAGTTSLYDWLAGHPQVYMSPVKEPMYFCPDVQGGLRRLFTHPVDEPGYMALFADAQQDQVAGEASTRYLVSHVAPGLVHAFNSRARVIAMLRNPVDLVHALHNERVSLGAEPITDFGAAVEADQARRNGQRLPAGANSLGSVYRDTALFVEPLERWFESFGRDLVHVIVFDDLVGNPAAEFQRVLKFLSVDQGYAPPSFAASNRSHRLRKGPLRVLLASRPAQWTAHRALPALLGENRTQRLARSFRMSRVNRAKSVRSGIPADLRAHLEMDFMPDVERLSNLLGRDFGSLWFGRPTPPDGASQISSAAATPSMPEPA